MKKTTRPPPPSPPRPAQRPSAATWPTRRPCWTPFRACRRRTGICHYGLISQITQAQWDRLFAVNVGGIYHCVNAVLPAMLHRQSGCILNVSSMWGQVGASCEACYSATKGAVLALTKALAQELGPSGIRVNCVSPGVILTDMVANVAPEVLAGLAQEAPLGKNGTPEDVAQAMVYLAGAGFVTGQNLPVNGGFVL